jgi:hypothetical protein
MLEDPSQRFGREDPDLLFMGFLIIKGLSSMVKYYKLDDV